VNLIEKYDNEFILLFNQQKILDKRINLLPFFVLVEDMNIQNVFSVINIFLQHEA